jgi:hypothetical protein
VAPPSWTAPAAAWSAPAPAPAEPEAPQSTTDAELAAGARGWGAPAEAAHEEVAQAAAEPAPAESEEAPPGPAWQSPAVSRQSDVAETMIAPPGGSPADREATTLMPAWQPPPAAPPPVAETMPAGRSASAFGTAPGAAALAELTIEAGPDAGHTHRAGDHAVRLGRSPDNDVILRDPATSGHHARMERRGDQFWIVDLGSTNGTLVNGEPIQEKQLNDGDRLTIGQNAVHFAILGA